MESFEKTQNINISKMICGKCKANTLFHEKNNNKNNKYNNKIYACNKCKINLCLLYKVKLDKDYRIINYDDNKNYIQCT